MLAARLFFVLDYYGHERVRVLNGGLAKWRRESRPLESAAPTITPRPLRAAAPPGALATASEVRASLGKAGGVPHRRAEPGRVHREGPGLGARRPHPGRGERGVDVHPEPGRHVQGCRRAPGALRRRRRAAGPDGAGLLRERHASRAGPTWRSGSSASASGTTTPRGRSGEHARPAGREVGIEPAPQAPPPRSWTSAARSVPTRSSRRGSRSSRSRPGAGPPRGRRQRGLRPRRAAEPRCGRARDPRRHSPAGDGVWAILTRRGPA